MENIKRPSKIEADEDLLKQQEEFLRERKKPSAQFISKTVQGVKDTPQYSFGDISKNEKFVGDSNQQILESQEDIIFDIQERKVSSFEPFVFQTPAIYPLHINDLISKNVKVSKFAIRRKAQSIFAQMLNSSNDENCCIEPKESEDSPALIDGSGLTPNAKDSEVKKIHEENLAKLSAMSKDEILQHQEELKQYLNPETLSFIKRRKEMKKDPNSVKPIQNIANKSSLNLSNENIKDLSIKVLRNEGNKECDALILEKVLSSENTDVPKFDGMEPKSKKKSQKEYEIPEEAKELIEGDNKGLWKNMNKIEKEKLEWMTGLPQPKPIDLKTGHTARFDFEGKLLCREADIPTYQGLHHHGEEPEVPGYSLEELFLLARSSLQSQRIAALNTIAHVLENNWYGMMDSCFDTPLLPLLLNAGIVPLLRWALDDTSLTSVAATITAIHSLLISKADEACLHKTFCWLNGHFVPQLEPQDLDEPNIIIEELTDADLIKLDVVKGFLRIDILPRFMYILKMMCPPPLVCKLVMEIFTRLAQHSPESAREVAEHPGLLQLLFEKFLPLNWHFIDSSTLTDTVGYSSPLYSALKLMRIIAASSKELAISLVEKYGIILNIKNYVTVQPIDEKLPAQDVQLMVIEALKIWHTFLCYGIGFNVFLDLFPIFLKQLDFCQSLDLNCDIHKHVKDFDYATHLFKTFEAVAVIASEQKDDKASSTAINVVFKKALVCLKKWIWQFSQEKTSSIQMTLLAACMNFIVTLCRKSHEGLTCEDWEPCSAAKDAFEKYLLPSIKSNIFHDILKNFRSYSLFLASEINGNQRDGKTIVSLGSVLYGEDLVPTLKEGTTLPLLSSILNYVLLYKNFFHDSGNECLEILFCSPVFEYLKAVASKELQKRCWFLKFETFYIYQLTYLSTYISTQSSIFHETAVATLPSFTSPEECLIEDLFENIIFNQDAIMKVSSKLKPLNSMLENDLQSLQSRLPVIAQCYVSYFLNAEDLQQSRNMLFRSAEIDTLFCLSSPSVLILQDWCFMPIFNLYKKAKERNSGEGLTPEETLLVISCLQWIYLCHILNLPVLKKMPASVEFYYLYLVFLLGEDLFRDEKIKALLTKCANVILKQKKLNLTKIKWNNINTFDDLYLEMLIQYEAVSYGDEMFGSFLVLPLQQNCRSQWKKLLLIEYSSILRFLRVALTKTLVPLENYLEPVETDIRVLSEYLKALASGNLQHRSCPLLYLMAIHHIHNFIFMQSDLHMKSQKVFISNILKCRKDLQTQIFLYLKVNVSVDCGFDMAEQISPENQRHLNNVMGATVTI